MKVRFSIQGSKGSQIFSRDNAISAIDLIDAHPAVHPNRDDATSAGRRRGRKSRREVGSTSPSTVRTSPASMNQPGSYGIDIWDTATGEGWDLTTATVKQVVAHERYVGQVMPDGTTITNVNPLVYDRF